MKNRAGNPRNYIPLILEGALFWFAWSFLDSGTVVSLFIERTTGNIALVGIAATLRGALFVLAQVGFGFFLPRVARPDRLMHRVGLLTRGVMLLMIPALALGLWGLPAAWLFIALYGFFFLADGVVGFTWTEVMVRTTPAEKRGTIAGYQQVIGGALGLVGSLLVGMLLRSSLADAGQFMIIFAANGGLLLVNAALLLRIRLEPGDILPPAEKPSLRGYPARLLRTWKGDGQNRMLIFGRWLHSACLCSVPLTLSLGRLKGLTPEQLSGLIVFSVAGQIAGSLLWSQISRRLGNRPVIALSCLVNVALAGGWIAMALSPPSTSILPVICAMVLLGSSGNIAYIGYTYRLLERSSAEDRPNYLVLQSMLLLPCSFLSAVYSGIIQSFGVLPMAILLAALSLTGAAIAYTRLGWRPERRTPSHRKRGTHP